MLANGPIVQWCVLGKTTTYRTLNKLVIVCYRVVLLQDVTTIEIMQLSRDWMVMGPRAAHNM